MSEFIKIEVVCNNSSIPEELQEVIGSNEYRIGYIRKSCIDLFYPSDNLHTIIETRIGQQLYIRDTVNYIKKQINGEE